MYWRDIKISLVGLFPTKITLCNFQTLPCFGACCTVIPSSCIAWWIARAVFIMDTLYTSLWTQPYLLCFYSISHTRAASCRLPLTQQLSCTQSRACWDWNELVNLWLPLGFLMQHYSLCRNTHTLCTFSLLRLTQNARSLSFLAFLLIYLCLSLQPWEEIYVYRTEASS